MSRSLRFQLLLACWAGPALAQAPGVSISIDLSQQQQVVEGFGSSVRSLVYGGEDYLTPELRQEALQAAYGQVGLNMGNLDVRMEPANDDANALNYAWNQFDWSSTRAQNESILELAMPLGADNLYPAHKVDLREMPWAVHIRNTDYPRYLNEMAEHVVAGMRYWRDSLGYAPRYMMLFNEPSQGDILSPQEAADLVRVAGQRLRAEGFADVMFVAPGESTEEGALITSQAIMADPEARIYVGAIAFHPYPYYSVYSSTRRILETSGVGQPDPAKVAIRQQLRALGETYGIPIWMTEVSLGPGPQDYPFGSFQNLRARAIHIHDEFRHTGASAFFGMYSIWDRRSHFEHFGTDDLYNEASTIALIDQNMNSVTISGMGFAIGHYARWMERGDIVVQSSSSDPLVQVTATRASDDSRLVMVLINNADAERTVTVSVPGGNLTGEVTGERSSVSERWAALPVTSPTSSSSLQLTLPAFTVTTVAVPMGVTTNEPGSGEIDGFSLGAPRPNPASGEVDVTFRLEQPGPVDLAAYDVTGRRVATVLEGARPAGAHSVAFDVSALDAGVYLLRLRGTEGVRSRRLSVVD
jgi:O-glycosyl hydrolase